MTTPDRHAQAAREIATKAAEEIFYRMQSPLSPTFLARRHEIIQPMAEIILSHITAALAAAEQQGREAGLTEAAEIAQANKPKDWTEVDNTTERIAAAIRAAATLRQGGGG